MLRSVDVFTHSTLCNMTLTLISWVLVRLKNYVSQHSRMVLCLWEHGPICSCVPYSPCKSPGGVSIEALSFLIHSPFSTFCALSAAVSLYFLPWNKETSVYGTSIMTGICHVIGLAYKYAFTQNIIRQFFTVKFSDTLDLTTREKSIPFRIIFL